MLGIRLKAMPFSLWTLLFIFTSKALCCWSIFTYVAGLCLKLSASFWHYVFRVGWIELPTVFHMFQHAKLKIHCTIFTVLQSHLIHRPGRKVPLSQNSTTTATTNTLIMPMAHYSVPYGSSFDKILFFLQNNYVCFREKGTFGRELLSGG